MTARLWVVSASDAAGRDLDRGRSAIAGAGVGNPPGMANARSTGRLVRTSILILLLPLLLILLISLLLSICRILGGIGKLELLSSVPRLVRLV